jgi:hypothetical protein
MGRTIVSLALVLALSECSPPSAKKDDLPPYSLLAFNWKYQAKPMGKNFEICVTKDTPKGAEQAIRRAAATWSYEHFLFSFKATGCTSKGAFPLENGVNQIDFGTIDKPGAAGVSATFHSKADMTECDVRLSSQLQWNTATASPAEDRWDVESAVLHELGHCLGLGDVVANPFNPRVMEESLSKGEERRALTKDDEAGRKAIYG